MNLNYEVANILINRARNNQITDYQELTEYILCFNDSESIKRLIKELPFDTKQHVARCMGDMGETERVNGFINTIKNEKQYVKKFAQNSIANNNITAPPDIIYTAVKNGFIDENDLSPYQRIISDKSGVNQLQIRNLVRFYHLRLSASPLHLGDLDWLP